MKAKCPWCGRAVEVTKKGACAPHQNYANVRCVGSGLHLSEAQKQPYYGKRIKEKQP